MWRRAGRGWVAGIELIIRGLSCLRVKWGDAVVWEVLVIAENVERIVWLFGLSMKSLAWVANCSVSRSVRRDVNAGSFPCFVKIVESEDLRYVKGEILVNVS